MTRHRQRLILALVVLVVAGAGFSLWWALQQVPDFYKQALKGHSDPQARIQAAEQFEQRKINLVDDIKTANVWSEEFTEEQVNGWLAEYLPEKHGELLPKEVSDPRVHFSDGQVLVGFRYKQRNYTSVVSLALRPWVPESNQLAVEIQWLRAGVVPIPLEKLFDRLSEAFDQEGWRTEMKQTGDHDVLIVHFNSDEPNAPVLEAVSVIDGRITVSGSRRSSADISARPDATRKRP